MSPSVNFLANRYLVLRDTREQVGEGWIFPESSECLGTERVTLKTGDYTILGAEGSFVIERKRNLAEFSKNITEKRFEKELERLESFEFPYLLLDFTMQNIIDFPANSGIPRYLHSKTRITTNFIISKLNYYKRNFKTEIFLTGGRGKEVARELFREMSEKING